MKTPEKIGRYRIERLLGQGAMGSVYLGVDPSLDRKVAIKTVKDLDLEEAAKKRFLERFRNEARAAARLSHPSIVQVFDVGDDPDVGPFLVLEYIHGPSLKQVLRDRGPLPAGELMSIAHQLGEALDVAHAAGIIHRDVKPDNVLVGEDGRAKLADFGVARVPDAALTKEGQFLGTPCYAAPETLSEGRYGPRTDLFSFAAVLYELSTGARAFPGDDAIAVAHAVIHDDPIPPTEAARVELPDTIDDVILRGLSKDDRERFGSARDLALALEGALVTAGKVAPSDRSSRLRPVGDLGKPSTERRGWLWLIALGVIALGAVAVQALGGLDVVGSRLGLFASMEDAGPVDANEQLDAAQPSRGRRDAGVSSVVVDEPIDAGHDAPAAEPIDAFTEPDAFRELSQREIEDLAKDEIDAARAAISSGDRAAATRHLARARELDPESSDLEEVDALLSAMP
ncbi:MAG: serine/threonine protein kinase [Deltaproteobacteria bacterium]|nr:serine/threonine protein kinase [Deltaproteobacteria bacterium]